VVTTVCVYYSGIEFYSSRENRVYNETLFKFCVFPCWCHTERDGEKSYFTIDCTRKVSLSHHFSLDAAATDERDSFPSLFCFVFIMYTTYSSSCVNKMIGLSRREGNK
jgi:hypothetical protein